MIDPDKDGIDHINIYSKGRTELGKWLSNFTYCPMLTEDGYFASVEAYWYWLLAEDHPRKDQIRHAYGLDAKIAGREISGKDWNDSKEFRDKIKKAILIKVNKKLDKFMANKLPFEHYYVYGEKIVIPKQGQWIVDFIDKLRIELPTSPIRSSSSV